MNAAPQRSEAGERTRLVTISGRQAGAALLTVLLIVAVMSTLAVAMTDSLRFAVRRSINVRDAEQATWYALGGEQLARWSLVRLVQQDPQLRLLTQDAAALGISAPISRGSLTLPIPEGFIVVTVRDGANCFNVNNLASTGENSEQRNRFATRSFALLLADFGVPNVDAERLANAVADWIDTDGAPRPGGAEDFDYVLLDPPHRAANMPIADLSELRAVSGFDETAYEGLRRYLCAPQTSAPSALNMNTLVPEQAVLLHAAMMGRITVEDARSVIAERPPEGFLTIEEVYQIPTIARILSEDNASASPEQDRDDAREEASVDPSLSDDPESAAIRRRLSIETQRYNVLIQVTYRQTYMEMRSQLVDTGTGSLRVARRRFGAL